MGYEKFLNASKKMTPKVSISSRGVIHINRSASEIYNKNKLQFVILYFDRELKKIKIEFTSKEFEPGTIKLRSHEKIGISIGAKSFCDYFNILPEQTKHYVIDKTLNLIEFKI